MVLALKPRSKPRIGTAKACTSQQADSSQLMHSSLFSPGTASSCHELGATVPTGGAGRGASSGTWRTHHHDSSGSASMNA